MIRGDSKWRIFIILRILQAKRWKEKAKSHLHAGAKRVVISAPAKDDVTPTATPNVGTDQLEKEKIT